MSQDNTTHDTTCPEGRERCAVDGVECECERREYDRIDQERLRNGPSPTVCRVMAKFADRLGHPDEAARWREAADMPRSEGNA